MTTLQNINNHLLINNKNSNHTLNNMSKVTFAKLQWNVYVYFIVKASPISHRLCCCCFSLKSCIESLCPRITDNDGLKQRPRTLKSDSVYLNDSKFHKFCFEASQTLSSWSGILKQVWPFRPDSDRNEIVKG